MRTCSGHTVGQQISVAGRSGYSFLQVGKRCKTCAYFQIPFYTVPFYFIEFFIYNKNYMFSILMLQVKKII